MCVLNIDIYELKNYNTDTLIEIEKKLASSWLISTYG